MTPERRAAGTTRETGAVLAVAFGVDTLLVEGVEGEADPPATEVGGPVGTERAEFVADDRLGVETGPVEDERAVGVVARCLTHGRQAVEFRREVELSRLLAHKDR